MKNFKVYDNKDRYLPFFACANIYLTMQIYVWCSDYGQAELPWCMWRNQQDVWVWQILNLLWSWGQDVDYWSFQAARRRAAEWRSKHCIPVSFKRRKSCQIYTVKTLLSAQKCSTCVFMLIVHTRCWSLKFSSRAVIKTLHSCLLQNSQHLASLIRQDLVVFREGESVADQLNHSCLS